MKKKFQQKIALSLVFLFCCQCVYAQEDNNLEKDTICIYKGDCCNVDGLPYYPDDYIYLIIKRQENVLFQDKTIGHNHIMVLLTNDFIVDSSNVMNFKPDNLSVYGIHYIEDANENFVYYWTPPDSEEYDSSSFDYSCLKVINDYLQSLVKDAEISSRVHGYSKGYEGTYALGLFVTPNNLECFKKLFEK